MLESNTEAKQATGTGSKLGPGVGGCAGKGSEGPSCPLGSQPQLWGLALTTAREIPFGVSAESLGNWGQGGRRYPKDGKGGTGAKTPAPLTE